MKKKTGPVYYLTSIIFLLMALPPLLYAAPVPSLVKDINATSIGSGPQNFAEVNGIVYFQASDGGHGTELWRTDGLSSGTYMVKDINPVPGSGSNPSYLTSFNNALYFVADDGIHGKEVWTSDGTESGTRLLADINSLSGSSASSLIVVNGILFFAANDGVHGNELWMTDGTNTAMVMDINTSGSSSPAGLTGFRNVLYFAADDGSNGKELWRSDGTAGNTNMVSDIYPGGNGSNPSYLTVSNDTLFFAAGDAAYGVELWKSDGSDIGTTMVKDIRPGANTSYLSYLMDVNGTLFFSASDGTNGTELWKSNGSDPDTVMVRNIYAGSGSSNPSNLIVLNNVLFFRASSGASGDELWKSEGADITTVMVKDIKPGSYVSSSPSEMAILNGVLYFAAETLANGRELWMSNGSDAGTTMVMDINPGSENGYPSGLVNLGGVLYFRATDGISGDELWKSDGTAAGTRLVKDINPTGGSGFSQMTKAGGTLFFVSDDGDTGDELWKSDGTGPGTVLVRDINSGLDGSLLKFMTNMNGTLLFNAYDGTDAELWKSDGTALGTAKVKDIWPGVSSSNPEWLTNVNGTIFFSADNGPDDGDDHGTELWKSDGTEAGTIEVKDICQGACSSMPSNMVNVGGALYFYADDGTHGAELWKSDGTAAGTTMVSDIYSGSGGSFPAYLTDVNGVLYFVADDGIYGQEVWMTDGITTRIVSDIDPNYGSSPENLTNVNGTLYFSAWDDGTYGIELWKTDGTTTQLVMDINVAGHSYPSNLTNVDGVLYFTADDGISGVELWKTDGNLTEMVMDVNTTGSSYPSNLVNVNGTLYFTADDGVHGVELWRTDGTVTEMVADIYPGAVSSDPANLVKVYGSLYFSASDPGAGTALFGLDISTEVTLPQTTASPAGGTYDAVQTVSLSCDDFGGSGCEDIYYTLDGSIPTAHSMPYSGPITISSSSVLKFFAIDRSGNSETFKTESYTIEPQLPAVSIASPSDKSIQKLVYNISGTAAEGGPTWGLDRVEIQVTDGTNYLRADNGWSTVPQWISVVGTADWSYDSSAAGQWANDTWYTVKARAFDKYGNSTEVTSGFYLYNAGKAYAELTLTPSTPAVLQGSTVSVAGKLTRLPDVGADMSGLEIRFVITDPSGASTEVSCPVQSHTNQYGQYVCQGLTGFNTQGVYKVKAHFAGSESAMLYEKYSAEASILVGTSAGYAIIVEGRIASSEGLQSHNKSANRVYDSLKKRGFLDDNIYYFNYVAQPGIVDAAPSKSAIQQTIEGSGPFDLATRLSNSPAPLYIIMVDHGNPDAFFVDTDVISPADLNNWLVSLETAIAWNPQALQQKRAVIIGSCYSGSFIPLVKGANRIIITSAAANEESFRGPMEDDLVRSGEFFIEELFKELVQGYTIKKAFVMATERTEVFTRGGDAVNSTAPYYDSAVQHPLLEDDGDGAGSNVLSDGSGDGVAADTVYLGVGDTNSATNPAEFVQIAPTLYLTNAETSATVWGTALTNNSYIDHAWVEIRNPLFILPPTGQPTPDPAQQRDLNITKEPLTPPSAQNPRFEYIHHSFTEAGRYEVYYFTQRTGTGEISSMKRSVVYRNRSNNTPPVAFELQKPDEGVKQKTQLVLDWTDSSDPDGLTYTVLISRDPAFATVDFVKEEIPYSTTLIGPEANLRDRTTYYWKVWAVDSFGEITESCSSSGNCSQKWRSFETDNTNGIPGRIMGRITDAATGNAIGGATITFSTAGSLQSNPDGTYAWALPTGPVDITATANGYQTYSITAFQIPPTGETVIKNIGLSAIIKGDVNGDNKVNIVDALLIARKSAGLSVTNFIASVADVNCDDKINIVDALLIARKSAGLAAAGWCGQ